MSINITPLNEDGAIQVAVTDKFHKQDYEQFVPVLEEAIKEHGKIRLLFDMQDFHGWDTAALWEDIKFDVKHHSHFERIAMVGERKWEKWMAAFCRPFTSGKVKYFDRAEKEDAKDWLLEGLADPA